MYVVCLLFASFFVFFYLFIPNNNPTTISNNNSATRIVYDPMDDQEFLLYQQFLKAIHGHH